MLNEKLKTNFLNINLGKREVLLICLSFSGFGPSEKVNYDFFSVKFFAKIYRYVPYACHVVLDCISFLEPENSKDQIEAHFLKKLAFLINKCLAKDALKKYPRTTKNFQNTQ